MATLTITSGHGCKSDGGFDCGSVGETGLRECDVTFKVVAKMKPILERHGHKVILTRQKIDMTTSLNTDVKIANESKSDLAIHIHNNSAENITAHGIETFYYTQGSEASKKLAINIQNELIRATRLTDRGVKTANFFAVKYTKMPSCLVELPFISNVNEERLLGEDRFLQICAEAICKGILKFLGQSYKEVISTTPIVAPPVKPIIPPTPKPVSKVMANIKALQQLCNDLGIRDMNKNPLIVDGVNGSKTEYCVAKLPLCGLSYTQRLATKVIQGFIGTSQDGIFGSGSASSLKVYQKSHSLVADGICGKSTWLSFLK